MGAGGRIAAIAAAAVTLGALGAPTAARALGGDVPVEHEPIPPDPREDLAMGVVLAGQMPAAIKTPSGLVSAPDPLRSPAESTGVYDAAGSPTFTPDRDTERPDLSAYDDPFTPSTAPFKRLQAFDSVENDYSLHVYDERLQRMPVGAAGGNGADEAEFFADVVVDLTPGRGVLVPSVGPGARVLRARLGAGSSEVAFRLVHDGADNWYVEPTVLQAPVRARLVMQLAIARGAFGGAFGGPDGDPAWSDLPVVPPLPPDAARDAAKVRRAIGVSRGMRPREAVARLVQYFRGFASDDEPPAGHGSIYLDLALSRKGVCRHRAFAFLVTAQSLGIPTRVIQNEMHAWVEVHDGTRWSRIDLGGAGRLTNPEVMASAGARTTYQGPADAYPWPQGAGDRGQNLARAGAGAGSSAGAGAGARAGADGGTDDPAGRPGATVVVAATDGDVHRGYPLRVAGSVKAGGEACPHAVVELWLRRVADGDGHKAGELLRFGTAATGDDGTFTGSGVVPGSAGLGDYDVVATTPGDARCAASRPAR
jgi:transglutaminase-like putative cysteine protease